MTAAPAPCSGRGARPWIGLALVALASVAVYLGCLGHGFVFDDQIQVERNLLIRDLGRSPEIFSRPTWPGYVYRPLPTFTYALTHAAFGLEPWAYHLTNVLLHAAIAVLLVLCLLELFDARLALVAGLLFAVHPVHVEAVASIANRTELLAALFALGGLYLLVFGAAGREGRGRGRRLLRLALAAASFFVALLAKESVIAFFLLVPLCLALKRRSSVLTRDGIARLARESLAPLAALAVATGAYFVVRQRVLGDVLFARDAISVVDNPMIVLPAGERLVRAWALLGRYVGLALLPLRGGADYSLGSVGLAEDLGAPDTRLYLALATGLAALTAWGVVRWRRPVAFFGLWFFAGFAVTANLLFPIGTVFADRLDYLPSLGVLGLVAWVLVRVPAAPLRVALCTLLVGVLSIRTVEQGLLWRDNRTLFRHEVATSPSGKAHTIYAEALSDAGALDAARAHFEEAIRIYPADANAQFGIALLELKRGRQDEGERWLAAALETDPRHVPSLLLLGRLTFRAGRVDDAARLFVRALNEENDSFDARLGILAACLERDNLRQAAELRAQLAALDPGHAELRVLSADLDRRLGASARSRGANGAPALAAPGPA